MKKKINTAVLLLAFGGPDSLNSVKPFLESVLAPRPITDEQVQRAKERYESLGGKSPLLGITQRQAKALENELDQKYQGLRVYAGMRHWHPFIKDTLAEMAKDGIKKSIAVSMAPHNSKASTGGYIQSIQKAIDELPVTPKVDFVASWHNHLLFLRLLADRIEKGLSEFEDRNKVHIIFSAHSLPKKLVENDPYVDQLNKTINGVIDIIGPLNYTLAYQSKGRGPLEWLEPSVDTILQDLAKKNRSSWTVSRETVQDVLLVPFGFVADHVETLYDIDIVYKKRAQSLGLNFKRTSSFNDSADFIKVLSSIVSEKLESNISSPHRGEVE